MANRTEARIAPPTDSTYPVCPICGWWDRKLRAVGHNITPEERIVLHQWAKHGTPLPSTWERQPLPPDEHQ